MAHDYRLNPFTGALDFVNIYEETHVIPVNSPYIVRLDEVPEKTFPSSIVLEIDGTEATEVATFPAQGEFWPDYSCDVEEDANWNTGAILFNSADAGKTIKVSYHGTGTLVDVEKTRALHGVVVFTEDGEWKCPPGITKVYVSMCGGGGGGASVYRAEGGAGGGGGGAQAYMKYAVSVVPHTTYNITIGTGGEAGEAGGESAFDELLMAAGGGAGGAMGTEFFYQGGEAGGPGGTAGAPGAQLDGIPGAGGGCLLGPGANSGDCTCYGGGGAGAATSGSTEVPGHSGGPGVVILEW